MEKTEVIRKKSFGISSNTLKIFAYACMLCDHVGYVLVDDNSVMRAIGRLAFPIFVFLLVEGYRHTSNVKKYILRLFVFALISEVPYDLAFAGSVFDISDQNVFFTLAAGLTAVYLLDRVLSGAYSVASEYRMILAFGAVLIPAILAEICRTDYGMGGIVVIILFYMITPLYGRGKLPEKAKRNATNTVLSAVIYYLFYGLSELYALFAIIPISFYNGKRGKKNKLIQYAFYFFYPLHLLCIYMVDKFFI